MRGGGELRARILASVADMVVVMEGSEMAVAVMVKVLALALWAVTVQSAGSKEQPPATLKGMEVLNREPMSG